MQPLPGRQPRRSSSRARQCALKMQMAQFPMARAGQGSVKRHLTGQPGCSRLQAWLMMACPSSKSQHAAHQFTSSVGRKALSRTHTKRHLAHWPHHSEPPCASKRVTQQAQQAFVQPAVHDAAHPLLKRCGQAAAAHGTPVGRGKHTACTGREVMQLCKSAIVLQKILVVDDHRLPRPTNAAQLTMLGLDAG